MGVWREQRNLADFLTRNGVGAEDADLIIHMFTRAASAYDPYEYEDVMHDLAQLSDATHEYLVSRNPETWARSRIPVCHYGKYTSNDAEAVNATFSSFKTSAEVFRMLRLVVEDMARRYDVMLPEVAREQLAVQLTSLVVVAGSTKACSNTF